MGLLARLFGPRAVRSEFDDAFLWTPVEHLAGKPEMAEAPAEFPPAPKWTSDAADDQLASRGAIIRELGTDGKFASLVQFAVDKSEASQLFTDGLARAQTLNSYRAAARREDEAIERVESEGMPGWPSDFPSAMAPEPDWKPTGIVSDTARLGFVATARDRLQAQVAKLSRNLESLEHDFYELLAEKEAVYANFENMRACKDQLAKEKVAAVREAERLRGDIRALTSALDRERAHHDQSRADGAMRVERLAVEVDDSRAALRRERGNHQSTSVLLKEQDARKLAIVWNATDVFGQEMRILFGPVTFEEALAWLQRWKPKPGVCSVTELNEPKS